MERRHASLEPVEFVVTRNPEVRVIFVDVDSTLIQILGGGRPLVFRGTEHGLWRFARTFTAETQEAFAEQAMDRSHSQTARVCSLQERLEELEETVRVHRQRLLVEQSVRTRVEKELTARDGHNRAQLKIARFVQAASTEAMHPREAGRR